MALGPGGTARLAAPRPGALLDLVGRQSRPGLSMPGPRTTDPILHARAGCSPRSGFRVPGPLALAGLTVAPRSSEHNYDRTAALPRAPESPIRDSGLRPQSHGSDYERKKRTYGGPTICGSPVTLGAAFSHCLKGLTARCAALPAPDLDWRRPKSVWNRAVRQIQAGKAARLEPGSAGPAPGGKPRKGVWDPPPPRQRSAARPPATRPQSRRP